MRAAPNCPRALTGVVGEACVYAVCKPWDSGWSVFVESCSAASRVSTVPHSESIWLMVVVVSLAPFLKMVRES